MKPHDRLVPLLLAHFDDTRRDRPWRRTSDPYAIWVSEVMMQQTRVETVIPYYQRWLDRFPDLDTLADAPEPAVLKAWEGLGYYSRARNLQAAARIVREVHNGRVPDTADALRGLPGIGAYTAGAISSIAYGRAEPAIDGNARRVFSRLLDIEQPDIPVIQRIVRDIVPHDRPGDFNQAVMELGATICTPRPHCAQCPVQSQCLAFVRDTVALRPGAKPRKTVPSFDVATVVIIDADMRTILAQRPDSGLLAGFREFPARIAARSALARAARMIAADLLGARAPRALRLDPISHTFSHRIEVYHPFVFRVRTTDPVCDVTPAWFARDELERLPLPVAQRRIARAVGL